MRFLGTCCSSGELPSPSKSWNAISRTSRRIDSTFTKPVSSRPRASSEPQQTRRSNTTTGPRLMVPMLSISISMSFVGKLGQRLLYPPPPTRLCCEFSSAEGISAADAGDRRDFATISKPSARRWILARPLRKIDAFPLEKGDTEVFREGNSRELLLELVSSRN